MSAGGDAMKRLEGQVAVITGGASGIGEATVRLFLQEGARVVIADIQDDRGGRLEAKLGEGARYLHTDVSREDDVMGAVDLAVKLFGRLDCMFNNAGIAGSSRRIDDVDAQAFDEVLAVHLRGVFLGMKHAARVMKPQGSGVIISTGSVAGLQSGFAGHAYSAAKAAIIHLTRSVAMDLREFGIRVNCICPGFIATPIFASALHLPSESADEVAEALRRVSPGMRPPGLPDDVAHAALWLASDESRFVNGHALVVDDALTAGRSRADFEDRGRRLAAVIKAGQDR